jgi:hypothetical protein
MRPRQIFQLGGLIALVTTQALANQETVEGCRQIRDAAARLACYDRIPVSGPPSSRPAPLGPNSPSPSASPAAEQSRPTAATVAAAKPVASAVPSDFDGWRPNARITLDNGQVWQVVDGSSYATRPGRRNATIREGLFGAYFLDIDGVAASPRVRRIK